MSLLGKALVGLMFASSHLAAQSQPLTIFVPAEFTSSSPLLKAMRKEAARLISPADYLASWLPTSAAVGASFEQLVVIRFTGQCSSRAEDADVVQRAPSTTAASLATTSVSGGQVLPFVRVDCDRTRRLIEHALAPLPSGARDTIYGRALGRVVAHELYHVLAHTTGHHAVGASKPCFSAADLLSSRFQFDPVSLAQMRPAPAAVQSPALTADAADGGGADGR